MTLMDVSDIARMLSGQIDTLVPHLLPAAVREGHEWRIGSCAGEPGRSMAIHCGGSRRGVWQDFSSDDKKGDALDLVAEVLFAGDKKQALQWARSWLGLDNLDPARLKQVRRDVQRKAEQDDLAAAAKAERRKKFAKAIWLQARPDLSGSAVELYLRGRGISLSDLSRPPNAIRFAPSLEYPPSLNQGLVQEFPAMVAAICDGHGEHIATHRTFLQPNGTNSFSKAAVRDARLSLGSYVGGFISLSRGPSGKAIKDAPLGDMLAITEGIETGLTVAIASPEYRVIAGISVGNFKNIILPQQIKHILICAENDEPGSEADKSLQRAIEVFMDQGRDVYIARSPVGKDFNDVLRDGDGLLTKEKLA